MNKPFWHVYFRPTPVPSSPLPLGARSIGHFRWPPRESDGANRKIHFVQIFWGISGTGALIINGKERKLGPRQVAVYLPDTLHRVYTLDEPWEYRWWTMDGPLAMSATVTFGLSADVFNAGPAPARLFRQLEMNIREASHASELRASALAFQLLACAALGLDKEKNDDVIEKATDKIHKEWNNPDLNVNTLADYLKLNRSVLSRRFHQRFGISPMTYIHNLRLNHALSLFKQKTKTVKEIAFQCGYNDLQYFSRIIHDATGISPRHIRNSAE